MTMFQQLRERFLHPGDEFSPVPFWFLNGDLREEELARQLRDFAHHGVRGVVLHPRIGIPSSLTYLSERFLALMTFAVREAAALGMWVVLYDEGMYPSGSANGQVVRENPAFAARGITLRDGCVSPGDGERVVARLALRMTGEDALDPAGTRLLSPDEKPLPGERAVTLLEGFTGGTIRGIHEDEDDGMPNAPRAADILNPEAVRCFLRLTHERYWAAMGSYFGTTIRAIFVDEPCPTGRCVGSEVRAWTNGLEAMLPEVGLTLRDLPALWLDAGPETQRVRSAYDRLIALRLGQAFYAPIQAWCHAHGIALTGHPAHPDDIALEQYFDIPGQDLVWRWVAPENGLSLEGPESTQALCAASAALHRGRARCADECFGCCGPQGRQWAFSVSDMLFYLNWLFARGVNLVFPHAFLYAADTPVRFGDRPPDVGPNNIWWPWYGRIARYIASSCALLTAGQARQPVTILTGETALPWALASRLYRRQIEFTYLERSLLREQVTVEGGELRIQSQRYRALAVEDAGLLDDPAIRAKLALFRAQGGLLLVPGQDGITDVDAMADALEARGLRTLQLHPATEQVRVLSRDCGDVTLYELVNEGDTAWTGTVLPPRTGDCALFSPWEGTVTSLPLTERGYPLTLPYRESVFLAVDASRSAMTAPVTAPPALRPLPLPLRWRATWPGGRLDPAPLGDWQTWPGMALYWGEVCYHADFTLSQLPDALLLDLGEVRDLACVTLNGHEVDALLKPPFTCALTPHLRLGENRLTIRVLSCLESRYGHTPCPAGLFGPVRLLVEAPPAD